MQVFCACDELVPIEDLRPNPKNPNRHPAEQIRLLAKIMKEQGWRAPITVSTRSGYIVRGHGRLLAAAEAGFSHCPVDFQEYDSDEAEKADLLADNRISELSSNDEHALDRLLGELEAADFDLELAGYALEDDVLEDEPEPAPEVQFTEVLNEEHNYLVLYFDNEMDWMQALTLFDVKPVKAFSTRMDGSENPKTVKRGTGRVLRGGEALERLGLHS